MRFIIYLHQQPLDAKRYKQVSTEATRSNPKQPEATRSNPKQPMTTANAHFKVYIENMPEALNTKKDVDEYCKQFWKDYKEKAKEAKAADKAAKADKPKRKKGFDKDGNPKEKRPPSAYNIFVKGKYAEIKDANPEMDKTEIFAEIARIWQEFKVDKAEEAKNDKKTNPTYEIEEIQEAHSDEEEPKKKSGRKPKKPEDTEA